MVNLLMVGGVCVRRFVKARIFRAHDRRRLAWARVIDRMLAENESRCVLTLTGSDRWAAEETLLQRWKSATEPERERLHYLFAAFGLKDWRQKSMRRRSQRAWAALVLSKLAPSDSVDAVLATLLLTDAEEQAPYIRALGRMGAADAIAPLMELLQAHPHRAYLVAAAVAQCARSSPESLLPYLHSAHEIQRRIAVTALATTATARETDAIALAASDISPEVRAQVARAFGRLGGRDAIRVLRFLADDPVWFVRLRAFKALDGLTTGDARKSALLFRGLQDPEWLVQETAGSALRRLALSAPAHTAVLLPQLFAEGTADIVTSAWERAAPEHDDFRWITSARHEERRAAKSFIEHLLAAKKTARLRWTAQSHPDPEVRWGLWRTLEAAMPASAVHPPAAMARAH
jgi:HEAT repeat protein